MADIVEFEIFEFAEQVPTSDGSYGRAPPEPQPVEEPVYEIKTTGQAVFLLYRQERVRQGYEEFKWESLDVAQQLVWQRLADKLGVKLP